MPKLPREVSQTTQSSGVKPVTIESQITKLKLSVSDAGIRKAKAYINGIIAHSTYTLPKEVLLELTLVALEAESSQSIVNNLLD